MRFRTNHSLQVLHPRKGCFDFFFSPKIFFSEDADLSVTALRGYSESSALRWAGCCQHGTMLWFDPKWHLSTIIHSLTHSLPSDGMRQRTRRIKVRKTGS